jgi:hypothetical protein
MILGKSRKPTRFDKEDALCGLSGASLPAAALKQDTEFEDRRERRELRRRRAIPREETEKPAARMQVEEAPAGTRWAAIRSKAKSLYPEL